MKRARDMTAQAIRDEIEELNAEWDDLTKDLKGYDGSHMEWLSERMDELEDELSRRDK